MGRRHGVPPGGPARACAGCCGPRRPTSSACRGTGAGEQDPGLLLALARFGGAPCVVLGQDRRGQSLTGPARAGGAARGPPRHAPRRGAAAAAGHPDRHPRRGAVAGGRGGRAGRRDRPLPAGPGDARGADAGRAAGAGHRRRRAGPGAGRPGAGRGQRLAAARCRPRVRRRSCTATIDRAGEMAAAQGVRATDLWRAGIVDRVVPERPDAADEPSRVLPAARPGAAARSWPGCWAGTTASASAAGCTATATWAADVSLVDPLRLITGGSLAHRRSRCCTVAPAVSGGADVLGRSGGSGGRCVLGTAPGPTRPRAAPGCAPARPRRACWT